MPGSRSRLQIEIDWRLRTDWNATPLLRRVAQYVARAERFQSGMLSASIVGQRAMATLHDRSLGIPEPTDVLTFDYGTDGEHAVLDGEIVVCADVALSRARLALGAASRNPDAARTLLTMARAELALYVTHGILHLAGYDDHAPHDFRRMHAREDELLKRFGLGPIFSRQAPSH